MIVSRLKKKRTNQDQGLIETSSSSLSTTSPSLSSTTIPTTPSSTDVISSNLSISVTNLIQSEESDPRENKRQFEETIELSIESKDSDDRVEKKQRMDSADESAIELNSSEIV